MGEWAEWAVDRFGLGRLAQATCCPTTERSCRSSASGRPEHLPRYTPPAQPRATRPACDGTIITARPDRAAGQGGPGQGPGLFSRPTDRATDGPPRGSGAATPSGALRAIDSARDRDLGRAFGPRRLRRQYEPDLVATQSGAKSAGSSLGETCRAKEPETLRTVGQRSAMGSKRTATTVSRPWNPGRLDCFERIGPSRETGTRMRQQVKPPVAPSGSRTCWIAPQTACSPAWAALPGLWVAAAAAGPG
jgi:hypothetical protein